MNVAIIPARGGSVRIPRKNIRLFHGKPIIAYSIEAAKESGLFLHVMVSTDDEEIAQVALDHGAGVVWRGAEMAEESVGTQEVARHAIQHYPNPVEYACCIYATAPMLTAEDLRYGLSRYGGYTYTYVPGWYYWGAAKSFLTVPELEQVSGLMLSAPENRYVDINTEDDWRRAEEMYAALQSFDERRVLQA